MVYADEPLGVKSFEIHIVNFLANILLVVFPDPLWQVLLPLVAEIIEVIYPHVDGALLDLH